MNWFVNYQQRKILVLISLIFGVVVLILLGLLISKFYGRITFEREWLTERLKDELKDKSQAEFATILDQRSTSFQLKTIFLVLVSIAISSLLISVFLSSLALYGLFSNRFNGNKIIRYNVWFVLIAFVMIFFIVALQPIELTIARTVNISGRNVNITQSSDRINYSLAWASMFISFAIMIILINSRLKYGFLSKDIILKRKFKPIA
ncbi:MULTISPECIES: hypothetical protein [unclassified Mycoplasma]|uniref:hypothetical protein n=1 Tax=unclassified Mycoplasma TaxID=2683645 RepID=UPI00211C5DE2|nr:MULTISPECIES: hypothetical protein [unclassified Mycoplasma]UUM19749.1 hypothetical protein NPA11_03195 [Mycoplasma sp. 1578d]UUM24733.1 hypothetical protein NPA12_03490 [Mycoplasma sp. 3686d]